MKTYMAANSLKANFKSVTVYFAILLFIIPVFCFSQVDTAAMKRKQMRQVEQIKQAQNKALQQMKDMGINIDPNKKMTKEEANKLKQQLLGKADEMKKKLPGKPTEQNKNIEIKIPNSAEVLQVANRFYTRSYKQLNAIEKSQFDVDYKEAEKNKFSHEWITKLTSKGAELITFGNNHHIACVYLTTALKLSPSDTLSANNFGGYLRIIDSLRPSLTVLLYANILFSQSPIILTQIGCSFLELGDEAKAEKYLKGALKYDPDFGQAHAALCDIYIKQNRLKDAILELFAGVKGMGASYNQASQNFQQIQMEYADTKEEFWNESKKQLDPSSPPDPLAPLVPGLTQIKMPDFPYCAKVEDWTLGGGQTSAMDAFQIFHNYNISFVNEFQSVHKQTPELPQNSSLRDYPNERFALDCITEMFMTYSKEESKKYEKITDGIVKKVGDAKLKYIERFNKYRQEYFDCLKPCADEYESCKKGCEKYKGDFEAWEKCSNRCSEIHDVCTKECYRKYCEQQCPNANEFNSILRIAYGNYNGAFNQMVQEQKKLLDDLYAFSDPWFTKIESSYWSKIYAYEVSRVAMTILENTFMHYPQFFDPPVNDDCGSDCSVFSTPFRVSPDNSKNNPGGNNCSNPDKFKIPLFICEIVLDCESVEFGCTNIISASVKRNFVKNNTTVFLGLGIKGDVKVLSVSAKAGIVMTFTDNGDLDDIGGKADVSVSKAFGPISKSVSSSNSMTVMQGPKTKVSFSTGGPAVPK